MIIYVNTYIIITYSILIWVFIHISKTFSSQTKMLNYLSSECLLHNFRGKQYSLQFQYG